MIGTRWTFKSSLFGVWVLSLTMLPITVLDCYTGRLGLLPSVSTIALYLVCSYCFFTVWKREPELFVGKASVKNHKIEPCEWEYDEEHERWETGCDDVIALHGGESPFEYGFRVCPYCGKQLTDVSK